MPRVSVRVPLEELQPKTVQAPEPSTPEPTPEPVAQSPEKAPKMPTKSFNKNYFVYAGGILLVLILVFVLLNDRRHLKQEVNKLSTTTANTDNTQADTAKYVASASKLVEVPSDKTPLVNKPSDDEIAKLKGSNPIYVNIQSKDVFLIYTVSDKSLFLVVYRPTTNKIILATAGDQPNSNPNQTTPGSTPTTTTPTKTTKP